MCWLRQLQVKAKKTGKRLYVALGGQEAPIVALTACAPRYGSPAFRCVNGDGWYPLNGAEWSFYVK